MTSNRSLLKGKRILTATHYGKVLNDAERENVIIHHAIRTLHTWTNNNKSIFSRSAGVPSTGSRWQVVDVIVAIPWKKAGIPQVSEKIPRFLNAHRLRSRFE